MQKAFRVLGYLEGASLLVLLGIAMPLKYVWGDPSLVRSVGLIHGMLFILYLAVLGFLSSEHHWPRKLIAWGLVAAVLPFGPFVFDRVIPKE